MVAKDRFTSEYPPGSRAIDHIERNVDKEAGDFCRNLILLTPVKSNLLVRKKGNKETGGTSAKHISYVNGFNSWMSERVVAPGAVCVTCAFSLPGVSANQWLVADLQVFSDGYAPWRVCLRGQHRDR